MAFPVSLGIANRVVVVFFCSVKFTKLSTWLKLEFKLIDLSRKLTLERVSSI